MHRVLFSSVSVVQFASSHGQTLVFIAWRHYDVVISLVRGMSRYPCIV